MAIRGDNRLPGAADLIARTTLVWQNTAHRDRRITACVQVRASPVYKGKLFVFSTFRRIDNCPTHIFLNNHSSVKKLILQLMHENLISNEWPSKIHGNSCEATLIIIQVLIKHLSSPRSSKDPCNSQVKIADVRVR